MLRLSTLRQEGKHPLVFIPHILDNMDSWDPSVTDGFAHQCEAILFNNAGVASSTGEVPTTFAEMAKSAGTFIDVLSLTTVDVFGFSTGSMIAQNVAMQRPNLVRKLVIVGSGPALAMATASRSPRSRKKSLRTSTAIPTTSGSMVSLLHRPRVRLPDERF